MQNFTEELKNEIISQSNESEKCRLAMLSAFIRTSGSIISHNGNFGFEIVTENEHTADYFFEMIEREFGLAMNVSGAKFDALGGRDKLVFGTADEKSDALLRDLRLVGEDKEGNYVNFGIDERLVAGDAEKIAFLKGAFLGGGSCTLPDEKIFSRTGYHLEFVFSNRLTAAAFCDLLCEFEILAKSVSRKDTSVVYVKSKEVISDVLNLLGCSECLKKLNDVVEKKDRQNNANRVNNCSVSNIDKTLTASVNQVQAIEVIATTIGLQSLEKQLFDVAECRLADKNASMQELSERLNVSKSCLNHRMRKILDIAHSLKD